mgnify:CR=1 FL=1
MAEPFKSNVVNIVSRARQFRNSLSGYAMWLDDWLEYMAIRYTLSFIIKRVSRLVDWFLIFIRVIKRRRVGRNLVFLCLLLSSDDFLWSLDLRLVFPPLLRLSGSFFYVWLHWGYFVGSLWVMEVLLDHLISSIDAILDFWGTNSTQSILSNCTRSWGSGSSSQ